MNSDKTVSPGQNKPIPTAWLKQIHQAILVVDQKERKICFLNPAACQLLGCGDAVLNQSVESLFQESEQIQISAGVHFWKLKEEGNISQIIEVEVSELQDGFWMVQPSYGGKQVENLLSHLQVAVMIVSDGKILHGNEAAVKLAGIELEQLKGKELESLFDANTIESLLPCLNSASGELELEGQLLNRNRSKIPVSIRAKTGQYSGQQCLWVILQNITRRKIAEEQQKDFQRQLQEQLEYSTLIFNQLPIGGWLIDFHDLGPEDRGNQFHQKAGFSVSIRSVNTTLQEMLGYSFKEFFGKSVFDANFVNSENAEIFLQELIERRKGNRGSYEVILTSKNGDQIPILLESIPILKNSRGETTQSVGLLVDLRERKEWEAELTRLNAKLEELSRTDQLTGLGNRRTFDENLTGEWERAKREQTPLSLIIVDVDFFKNYNDHYGHLGGDQCLQSLAKVLHEQFRRICDMVSRYGGEEFAILLPNTPPDKAMELAEHLRIAVEEAAIPHAKSQVSGVVTLSLGVSTIKPRVKDRYKDLVHLADEALYESKAAGRNRVTLDSKSLNAKI